MICKVLDLRHKEVINSKDGCRLGFVDDVEIDTQNATVLSLIIYGRLRCFGLLGRDEDVTINWEYIKLIGEDTILVSYTAPARKKKGLKNIFFK
ncbi:MAG: YlmC/YmxH family sporulation protein [Acutalibacteraceae bacterium]|nr:YlmC/YmxH family sporulation protein [Acutalibacteraceae bacterium]